MTVMVLALATAMQAGGAPVVEIENFIGTVRVIEGDTLDARFERSGEARPDIRNSGGELRIDGGEGMRRVQCYGSWREQRVGRSRRDAKSFDDWPVLIITTPTPVAFELEDSVVRAEIGDTHALNVEMSHCSTLNAGDVDGDARLAIRGSGNVRVGEVGGALQAALSGSGALSARDIGEAAELAVSGSGNAELGDVGGGMEVGISGSGYVRAGHAASLDASVSGSGNVEMGNARDGVRYAASGSGDLSVGATTDVHVRSSGSSNLSVASMNGVLNVSSGGSGNVRIEQGRATRVEAVLAGSSDLWFGGTAGDVDVRVSGGSDAYIRTVTGQRNIRTSGGGDFSTGR